MSTTLLVLFILFIYFKLITQKGLTEAITRLNSLMILTEVIIHLHISHEERITKIKEGEKGFKREYLKERE
jgi:tryptophan synthase alpha subunit